MHAAKAFELGVSYLESDEIDMALVAFGEAIRIEPTFAQAYNGRSVAHGLKDQLEAALADCHEAIRLAPCDPEFYRTRGYLYERLGDEPKAQADLTKADRLERGEE